MSVSDDPPGDGSGDPFDGLDLDDEWAAGASIREPSARSRSLQGDLTRIEAEQAADAAAARKQMRRRRVRRRGLIVLGLAAFIGAVALADRDGGSSAATWSSVGD